MKANRSLHSKNYSRKQGSCRWQVKLKFLELGQLQSNETVTDIMSTTIFAN